MEMALAEQQIKQFTENGYLLLPKRVSAAACELMLSVTERHVRDAIAPLEYEAEVGYPGAPASVDAPGGRTIRRLRDVYHRHSCFQAWGQDPGLRAQLTQIFREPACLAPAHHNCVMTKHPDFGTATSWHRDIRYWSFTRPDLISVWLALGTETGANGGLQFIPRSHRMQIAPEQLDALDFLRPDRPENHTLFAQGTELALQQGDVVFFHSGLFHAAGRNTSSVMKASVVFAYRGQSNLPLAGSRSAVGDDGL